MAYDFIFLTKVLNGVLIVREACLCVCKIFQS